MPMNDCQETANVLPKTFLRTITLDPLVEFMVLSKTYHLLSIKELGDSRTLRPDPGQVPLPCRNP